MNSIIIRRTSFASSSSRWMGVAALDTAVRLKSTLAPTKSVTECPYSHGRELSPLAKGTIPTLQHAKSFPIIGSMIPQLSGIPNVNPLTNAYEFWIAMSKQYGEWYTFGSLVGGNPNDIYITQYIINDPREYMKIIRAGGKYPSGVLEILWVNERWSQTRGFSITEGIHGRGEEWRRVRTFLQTDLLHPESAKGYLPGISVAADLASKGAKAASELQSLGKEKGAINSYLNRCAFDMFSSMMLGIKSNTADISTPTEPANASFVKGAVQGLGTSIEMLFSPWENIVGRLMKLETAKMKIAFQGFDTAWEIAKNKMDDFIERKERGELTENEEASYFNRALERQKEEDSNVSLKEVKEIAFIGLFAAVDTTSSVLGWNLFHIARCPVVQEKLYEEISAAVASTGDGKITTTTISKSNAPYLHAIIRESHRLTPTGAIALNKTVDVKGLEIHGRDMAKGDVVLLESYTPGMNPALVDDPEEFKPERWLKDAVESRKGTKSEVIDHPFLATPFSQGARKCPGSRVASNEIRVLLSQLVLDWKMTSPVTEMYDITYEQHTTVEVKLPCIKFEARR